MLENIKLSEISQIQKKKPNTLRFHFSEVPRIGKFIEMESIIEFTRGKGKIE